MNQKDVKGKNQGAIRLSDVEILVLETENMRFKLSPRERVVNYRHIISPRDGWMDFPDDFFNERRATVSEADMESISNSFGKLFLKYKVESELEPLPEGAERKAYLKAQASGTTFFYTDTHASNDGYRVETEPVAEDFIQIIRLLSKYVIV